VSTGYALDLRTGARFRYDGRTWSVTAFTEGGSLQARAATGQRIALSIQHLVLDPSFSALGDGTPVAASEIAIEELLTPEEKKELDERTAHVREALTGFKSGDRGQALDGEPRPEYDPRLSQKRRNEAKAAEIGVHPRTIENLIRKFRESGPDGLIDARKVLPRVDHFATWRDTAAALLAERTDKTRVGKNVVIPMIDEQVRTKSPSAPIPSKSVKYEILDELDTNHQYFTGSTKTERGRAAVPDRAYAYKNATRPAQYVVLDTTVLDVFAMNPLDGKWVRCQLTLAMDWCTRCIVGLSLTAHSTRAKDVASVLYQVVLPRPVIDGKSWPYVGVPENIVVDETKTIFGGRPLGPALFPEGIVVDHGRQYISRHVVSMCHRFGIHIQPARKGRGSDKGILERYFRTIREGFLQHLAGYTGPDLASRGRHVEEDAYYFIDELEGLLRDWIEDVYHRDEHGGLRSEFAPGVELSPEEMYRLRIGITGQIRVPARADLAIDFLPVVHRKINHYGVEFAGLIYNGNALQKYKNTKSHIGGKTKKANLWPIAFDPDDVRRVFFQDGRGTWHLLYWQKNDTVGGPLSMSMLDAVKELLHPAGKRRGPMSVADVLSRLPLASARSVAGRKALVRETIKRRDPLTHDVRTLAGGPDEDPTLDVFEQIARTAAVESADLESEDWDDVFAGDDSTYPEA
jgi:transposase InsO family protein